MDSFWGARVAVTRPTAKKHVIGSSKWVAGELLKTSTKLEKYYEITGDLVQKEMDWLNSLLEGKACLSEISMQLQSEVVVPSPAAEDAPKKRTDVSLSPVKKDFKRSRLSNDETLEPKVKPLSPKVMKNAEKVEPPKPAELINTESVELVQQRSDSDEIEKKQPEEFQQTLLEKLQEVYSVQKSPVQKTEPVEPAKPGMTAQTAEPVVSVELGTSNEATTLDKPQKPQAIDRTEKPEEQNDKMKRSTLASKTPNTRKSTMSFATLPSRGPISGKSAKSHDAKKINKPLLKMDKQGVKLLETALKTDSQHKLEPKLEVTDATTLTARRDSFFTRLTVSPTPKPNKTTFHASTQQKERLAKSARPTLLDEESPFLEKNTKLPPVKTSSWLTVPPLGKPLNSSPTQNTGSPVKQVKTAKPETNVSTASNLMSLARKAFSPIRTALSPSPRKPTTELKSPARVISRFMQPTQASVARMTAAETKTAKALVSPVRTERKIAPTSTTRIRTDTYQKELVPTIRTEPMDVAMKKDTTNRVTKPQFSLLKQQPMKQVEARAAASIARGSINMTANMKDAEKPKPVPLTALSLNTASRPLPVKTMRTAKQDAERAKQRQSGKRVSQSKPQPVRSVVQPKKTSMTQDSAAATTTTTNVVPKETREEFIQRLSSNLKSSALTTTATTAQRSKSVGRVFHSANPTAVKRSQKRETTVTIFNDTTLPEIMSDDDHGNGNCALTEWAQAPNLAGILLSQQRIDPSTIFGDIPKVTDDVFKTHERGRPRLSSAQWTAKDMVTEEEKENYRAKMGFH